MCTTLAIDQSSQIHPNHYNCAPPVQSSSRLADHVVYHLAADHHRGSSQETAVHTHPNQSPDLRRRLQTVDLNCSIQLNCQVQVKLTVFALLICALVCHWRSVQFVTCRVIRNPSFGTFDLFKCVRVRIFIRLSKSTIITVYLYLWICLLRILFVWANPGLCILWAMLIRPRTDMSRPLELGLCFPMHFRALVNIGVPVIWITRCPVVVQKFVEVVKTNIFFVIWTSLRI